MEEARTKGRDKGRQDSPIEQSANETAVQIETEGRVEGWTKARQNVGRGRAKLSRAERR